MKINQKKKENNCRSHDITLAADSVAKVLGR